MKQASLADIDYTDALRLVGLRKEALDSGSVEKISSESLADSFFLRDIGVSYLEKLSEGLDPALNLSLLGGGLGAAYGAGKSLLSDDEDERKSLASNTLLGGVSGAALGGGIGLLTNPKSQKKVIDSVNSPTSAAAAAQKAEAAAAAGRVAAVSDARAKQLNGQINMAAAAGAGVATGYGVNKTITDLSKSIEPVTPVITNKQINQVTGDALEAASVPLTAPVDIPGQEAQNKRNLKAHDDAVARQQKVRTSVNDIIPESAWDEPFQSGPDKARSAAQKKKISDLLALRKNSPAAFEKQLMKLLKDRGLDEPRIRSLMAKLSPAYDKKSLTRPRLFDFTSSPKASKIKALKALLSGGLTGYAGTLGWNQYRAGQNNLQAAQNELNRIKSDSPGYLSGDN
jgi:hypothetical protein